MRDRYIDRFSFSSGVPKAIPVSRIANPDLTVWLGIYAEILEFVPFSLDEIVGFDLQTLEPIVGC